MVLKSNSNSLEATAAQAKLIEAVLSGQYSELCFGGAIRGGKTLAAFMVTWLLCKVYPGSRWAVVRKDLPTLKRNTIPSWSRFAPRPFVGKVNRSSWSCSCTNGSEIIFFPESVSTDPDYNRWRGLEVNGFILEEANELAEATHSKAMERAGSWQVLGGQQPKPFVLCTTNPDDGYIKHAYHDPYHAGELLAHRYFQPATIYDNPHLDEHYLANLERMKETDPDAYARFVLGDWSALEHPEQLISWAWCRDMLTVGVEHGPKRLGVDVARSEKPGADDTVLAPTTGNLILPLCYYHGKRTDETAAIVRVDMDKRGVDPEHVSIDTVGVGAGVWDRLAEDGIRCHEFVAGARAVPEPDSAFTFKNRRSQAWWRFAKMLERGEVALKEEDHRLFEELTAPRYKISGDKVIEVESKDGVRKRIGRSTDAADAVIQAFAPREDELEVFLI